MRSRVTVLFSDIAGRHLAGSLAFYALVATGAPYLPRAAIASIAIIWPASFGQLLTRVERRTGEGWTAEYEDEHDDGSLALAGAACAIHAADPHAQIDIRVGRQAQFFRGGWTGFAQLVWPASRSRDWWKPKYRRRDLERAASLLSAEIKRLDRMTANTPVLPPLCRE